VRTRPGKAMMAGAAGILLFYVALRLGGAAEDTSFLSGMPQSDASYVVGPLYVLATLAVVTLAPILAIAGVLEIALAYACAARRGVRPRRGAVERAP
jgi:hypothetical protein